MATTTEHPRVSLAGMGLAATGSARRVALIAGRAGVAGPVAVVAGVLAVLLAGTLASEHWNVMGLIQFGRAFAGVTHPPPGAPVGSAFGYDGQFYWTQAQDPLLLHSSTLVEMARFHPDFLQRGAYPLFAYLLAFGQRSALPAAMVTVDILSVLAITGAVAAFVQQRGRSPWWALAVGLTPGLLMPVLRDLSDPLAIATMLGGLLAWESGRRWQAALLLATASLAREPMIVGIAGVAADVTARAFRARRDRGELLTIGRQAWPVLAVPVAAFVAWQTYIRLRYNPALAATATATGPLTPTPDLQLFAAWVGELHRTLRQDSPIAAAWDISYMALVLCAMGWSAVLLRRGIRAVTVTAVLLAAMLPIVFFDDEWSISRYGAPVFVTLLLAGLQVRSRTAVTIAVAAAALTPFVPVMIAGI